MTQNISHAVMNQRHEPHDSLDDFPTPPWATRALLTHVLPGEQSSVWEPAANRGHMVKPLREYFQRVFASDVHDYGVGFAVEDFLFPQLKQGQFDWVITNPPFRLAEDFVHRALKVADKGVAIFIRSTFLESVGRWQRLFEPSPPQIVAQFSERVVLHKGKLTAKGSTATAYCWIVWRRETDKPTQFRWIPPCRKALERASDYEPDTRSRGL